MRHHAPIHRRDLSWHCQASIILGTYVYRPGTARLRAWHGCVKAREGVLGRRRCERQAQHAQCSVRHGARSGLPPFSRQLGSWSMHPGLHMCLLCLLHVRRTAVAIPHPHSPLTSHSRQSRATASQPCRPFPTALSPHASRFVHLSYTRLHNQLGPVIPCDLCTGCNNSSQACPGACQEDGPVSSSTSMCS